MNEAGAQAQVNEAEAQAQVNEAGAQAQVNEAGAQTFYLNLLQKFLQKVPKAKKYLLTGDLLTAAEAERVGLISDVVSTDQLDEASYGLAERLEKGATKAIRWTKITTNLALKQLVHSHFDAGIAYEMVSNSTADHREAIAALRERRDAVFTGR